MPSRRRAVFGLAFLSVLTVSAPLVVISGCGGGGGGSGIAIFGSRRPPVVGGAYTLIDLGTVGRDSIQTLKINSRSQVLGTFSHPGNGPLCTTYSSTGYTYRLDYVSSFLYQPGKPLSDGTTQEITPPAYASSLKQFAPTALNASGQIVGEALTYQSDGCGVINSRAAAFWDGTRDGRAAVTLLPPGDGRETISATDISDNGYIVGQTSGQSDDGWAASYRYKDGVLIRPYIARLGQALLNDPPAAYVSGETNSVLMNTELTDVNDNGEACGTITYTLSNETGARQAFGHGIILRGETLTDIGTPAGTNQSGPTDISPTGAIVGFASRTELASAYPQDGQGFLWRDGKFTRINGMDATPIALPRAINRAGIVVGVAITSVGPVYTSGPGGITPQNQSAPFLWRDGDTQPLNNLIAPDSGWEISDATDINDAGNICGIAKYRGGKPHAIMLVPR